MIRVAKHMVNTWNADNGIRGKLTPASQER